MKAIAVDDELFMLETLEEAVKASSDIGMVETFTSCSAALAYATENPVDIAFLDINMRGIGGLGLAEKLIALQPRCKIVFCTGYEEYAVSAFQLHVSGYLMKPITAEAVQKEMISPPCSSPRERWHENELTGLGGCSLRGPLCSTPDLRALGSSQGRPGPYPSEVLFRLSSQLLD